MILNPVSKTVTYKIENLSSVAQALFEIEETALNNDSVSPDSARSIVSDLNSIRDSLSLKRGVQRHEKFAPELQSNTK